MMYPPTRLDQFLHRLPGGDEIAHHIGVLRAKFRDITEVDEVRAMKARVAEDIAPIAGRLAALPADENGRRWHTHIATSTNILDGTPLVDVTFGHFNAAEERAFLFFERNGGSPVYPANGVRWTEVHARSYDLSVPADRGVAGRPIYQGMLPEKEGSLRHHSSHRLDRFAAYFTETAQPKIEALGNFEARPKAAAPAPAPLAGP